MYSKRVWLNKDTSSFTGSVVLYDAMVRYPGDDEDSRKSFVEIADCQVKVRLHNEANDDINNFADKIDLLANELKVFVSYLRTTKLCSTDKT